MKRFNLDVVFSKRGDNVDELPCLTNPTSSIKIQRLNQHRCAHRMCGNLTARIVHRMDEYDDDKQNGFLIKAVAGSECKQNEDYIKNNEELITLLKLKTKQVTEENQKLMDRRGRYN